MIDRVTMHFTLQEIADYFWECRKNAALGSSAEVRFSRYIEATEEADKILEADRRADND